MSQDLQDLRRRLEEQLNITKNFPSGPSYKSMRKNLAKVCLESDQEQDAIFHLVESHTVSLRTRVHARSWQCSEKEPDCGLDGSLVQHDSDYESRGTAAMLERLHEMPEEWSLVQITYGFDPHAHFQATVHPTKRPNPSVLHITRFECGRRSAEHPPYCVTVHLKENMLQVELQAVIDDHQNLRWGIVSSDQYYRLKGALDMRMKNVVSRLQGDWLRWWACLLIGRYVDPDSEQAVVSFVDRLLDEHQKDVAARTRRCVHQLAKACVFLPVWDLQSGLAECMGVPATAVKDLARQLAKVKDVVKLHTTRRHPTILLLDEELELFPWEMLTVILDHPVSRMPSLHLLYALYRAHEANVHDGLLHVDAALGYYIVNPEQNLPRNEKRLRSFLTDRVPSWTGTFGVTPTSEVFRDALQNYSLFIYSGHGSGSQFLQGDEIQKLKVGAVTFLFGCSSVTNKDLGGRVEPYGMWHFYLIAGCPMVVGNLWPVTDAASDSIAVQMLHAWLPGTEDMASHTAPAKTSRAKDPDAPERWRPNGYLWTQESNLLHALRRGRTANKHYLASAAIVCRGLPVNVTGRVE